MPASSVMATMRKGAIVPGLRTSATLARRVQAMSAGTTFASYSPMRTTASPFSEASTTPRTTSPGANGVSQSSRWMRSGKRPSLSTDSVGGTNPRARRSMTRSQSRTAWLATTWVTESSVV